MTAVRTHWPLGAALVVGIVIGWLGYARLGPNVIFLDPGVQTAILFVVGILFAGVLTLSAALVTSTNQAAATRRDRLDDRRIEQSVAFLNLTERTRDQQDRQFAQWREAASKGGPPSSVDYQVNNTDPIKDVVNALYLVATQKTADAARDALFLVDLMDMWSYNADEYGTGPKVDPPPPDWMNERIKVGTDFVARKTTFINAMRAEFDQDQLA